MTLEKHKNIIVLILRIIFVKTQLLLIIFIRKIIMKSNFENFLHDVCHFFLLFLGSNSTVKPQFTFGTKNYSYYLTKSIMN